MSQINPFTGSVLQTPQVQRQQAVDKDRQIQRQQDLEKNAALADDRLQNQVESSEELTPIDKQQRHERRFKRSQHRANPDQHDDDEQEQSGLDVTA